MNASTFVTRTICGLVVALAALGLWSASSPTAVAGAALAIAVAFTVGLLGERAS